MPCINPRAHHSIGMRQVLFGPNCSSGAATGAVSRTMAVPRSTSAVRAGRAAANSRVSSHLKPDSESDKKTLPIDWQPTGQPACVLAKRLVHQDVQTLWLGLVRGSGSDGGGGGEEDM